jgi:hypothetical protein
MGLFLAYLGHFWGSVGSHLEFFGLKKGPNWSVRTFPAVLQPCSTHVKLKLAHLADLSGHKAMFNPQDANIYQIGIFWTLRARVSFTFRPYGGVP